MKSKFVSAWLMIVLSSTCAFADGPQVGAPGPMPGPGAGGAVPGPGGALPGAKTPVSVTTGEIVSILGLTWTIVKDNRPTISNDVQVADALPPEVKGWQEMTHWQPLTRNAFHYAYKNRLGRESVSLDYEIQFMAQGTHKGVGYYISNLRVLNLNTSVAWGYKLNVKAMTGRAINAGSPEHPIALIPLTVMIEGSHPFKAWQRVEQFLIRGDGQMQRLQPVTKTVLTMMPQ